MTPEDRVRRVLADREAKAAGFLAGGAQLGMFGPEGETVEVERRGVGRPPGSVNKRSSKVREYFTARGYRDPAEQLAMIAGLDRPDLHPMAYAAQVAQELGEDVTAVLREMRQAAGELLPYWHAKLTPDVQVQAPVQILMAGPGGAVGLSVDGAAGEFEPLDVRYLQSVKTVAEQGLGDVAPAGSDAGTRTE